MDAYPERTSRKGTGVTVHGDCPDFRGNDAKMGLSPSAARGQAHFPMRKMSQSPSACERFTELGDECSTPDAVLESLRGPRLSPDDIRRANSRGANPVPLWRRWGGKAGVYRATHVPLTLCGFDKLAAERSVVGVRLPERHMVSGARNRKRHAQPSNRFPSAARALIATLPSASTPNRGWHVPERSEGRGLLAQHALRCAQGRATQYPPMQAVDKLTIKSVPARMCRGIPEHRKLRTLTSPDPRRPCELPACARSP